MTKIKFTTTQAKTPLSSGALRYQGQLQHNKVLDTAMTRRAFADHAHRSEPEVGFYLDALGEYIADAIAEGDRLDFGPFAVGLKMRGSLPAANAPFDPTANAIAVELMASKKLKAAAKSLKPVNVSGEAKSHILTTLQVEPYEVYDEMAGEGVRKLLTTGDWLWVHPGTEGEGVWVESDTGEKLAEGTILETDHSRCLSRFEEPIAPGLHWFVIASRVDPAGNLLRTQRRITVV